MTERSTTDKTLTQTEAAALLSVSPRTLESWRVKGCGPEYLRYSSRCIRYLQSEVEQWKQGRRRNSTSQPR